MSELSILGSVCTISLFKWRPFRLLLLFMMAFEFSPAKLTLRDYILAVYNFYYISVSIEGNSFSELGVRGSRTGEGFKFYSSYFCCSFILGGVPFIRLTAYSIMFIILGLKSYISLPGDDGTITWSFMLNSHNPVDESYSLKLKTSESIGSRDSINRTTECGNVSREILFLTVLSEPA